MPDRYGPLGVLALMIPQQNSNMQPEHEMLRPDGVSNQTYRFDISVQDKVPEAMVSIMGQARGSWPDMVLCANSVEMRNWSLDRQIAYRADLAAALPDTPIVTAGDACVAALNTVGAKRIGLISPMSEEYSESARGFYRAHGFAVPETAWLHVKTSDRIIDVPMDAIHAAFDKVNTDQVDTILHVGGALGIADIVDDLEDRLGKPVISSTSVGYWYALRMMGLDMPLNFGGQITRQPLPAQFRDPTRLVS
ncbi:hypothetical protein K3728_08725 [Rhodobacteraceae bacterium M385]|nr:hypothetical protein K3728_08725 [Rhodobacteraceae bacterium M385]